MAFSRAAPSAHEGIQLWGNILISQYTVNFLLNYSLTIDSPWGKIWVVSCECNVIYVENYIHLQLHSSLQNGVKTDCHNGAALFFLLNMYIVLLCLVLLGLYHKLSLNSCNNIWCMGSMKAILHLNSCNDLLISYRVISLLGQSQKCPRSSEVTLKHKSTEMKMGSFCWNFHHWLHWKLSKWQLPVQPVMKISTKWPHFYFSILPIILGMYSISRWVALCNEIPPCVW